MSHTASCSDHKSIAAELVMTRPTTLTEQNIIARGCIYYVEMFASNAQRQPFTDLSINCICFKTLHFNPNAGCLLHFVIANVYVLLFYTMKQTLYWGVTCTKYMGHNIINDLSGHAKLDHMMLLLLVTKESSSNTCCGLILVMLTAHCDDNKGLTLK
jgi:hypothetical protein